MEKVKGWNKDQIHFSPQRNRFGHHVSSRSSEHFAALKVVINILRSINVCLGSIPRPSEQAGRTRTSEQAGRTQIQNNQEGLELSEQAGTFSHNKL